MPVRMLTVSSRSASRRTSAASHGGTSNSHCTSNARLGWWATRRRWRGCAARTIRCEPAVLLSGAPSSSSGCGRYCTRFLSDGYLAASTRARPLLSTGRTTRPVSRVLLELTSLGYAVHWMVLDLRWLGVAQTRPRKDFHGEQVRSRRFGGLGTEPLTKGTGWCRRQCAEACGSRGFEPHRQVVAWTNRGRPSPSKP